jgi:hypothetical protein
VAHARGVYREHDTFPGIVVFKVFNCAGRRLSYNEVPDDIADCNMFRAVELFLERKCPVGHTGRCPSAEPKATPVVDAHQTLAFSREPQADQSAPQIQPVHLESSA